MGGTVQAWVRRVVQQGEFQEECVDAIWRALQLETFTTERRSLHRGLVCAIARLADAEIGVETEWEGRAPLTLEDETSVVRCGALHALIRVVTSQECRIGGLVAEVAGNLQGQDVTVAARCLDMTGRLGLVSAMECLVLGSDTAGKIWQFAWACLSCMAKGDDA